MSPQSPSYIIVGAGVFGASTALHLINKYPGASITLIDRNAYDAPTRVAASWDWNKVIRADYGDIFYTRLALEAQDIWRSEPLWKPFYHETGIFWISRTGFAQQVIDNFRQLGAEADLYAVPVEEAKKRYGGLFADADYTGIENVLINKTSGWADAKGALQAVIERAVELGVKYVTAEVDLLKLEDGRSGACTGVRTRTGQIYEATHTVLATGSFTAKLLEQTADTLGRDTLRAGRRMIAAGVTTGLTTLDDQTVESLAHMPVCIQENPPERGASNGNLPPNKEKQLKWWGQYIFQNTQAMPSGRRISMPPPYPDYAQWDVPRSLKEDVAFANKITFGDRGKDWVLQDHRICWESATPSADFIISPHSGAEGLYIATCGSFHGWKFFPVIGRYVIMMLEGTLEPELVNRWAWDRELPDVVKHHYWPQMELKDLL